MASPTSISFFFSHAPISFGVSFPKQLWVLSLDRCIENDIPLLRPALRRNSDRMARKSFAKRTASANDVFVQGHHTEGIMPRT